MFIYIDWPGIGNIHHDKEQENILVYFIIHYDNLSWMILSFMLSTYHTSRLYIHICGNLHFIKDEEIHHFIIKKKCR